MNDSGAATADGAESWIEKRLRLKAERDAAGVEHDQDRRPDETFLQWQLRLKAERERRSPDESFAQWRRRLKAEREQQPAPARFGTVLAVDDPRVQAWVDRKLEAQLEEVAHAPVGTRNHTLNVAAYTLGRLAPTYLDPERLARKLTVAALAAGLPEREARRTIASGLNSGMARPREVELAEDPLTTLEGLGGIEETTGVEAEPEVPGDAKPLGLWCARPVLEHLHAFARARRVAPWAVLGVVLARVVTATPVDVVLPPLVGSEGSLNTFVALVGPSGAGKGAGEAAAADAVSGLELLEVATIGSGEGIAHLFAHREKGVVLRDREAVLFTVPEVDNLTALGNRQGATLLPQLRSGWMGEQLGFAYADPTKRLPIARHTYRLALVLGVQPGRAAPLLEDVDGGTPQRFLWLPTTDPHAPEEAPSCPPPWLWPGVPVRTASDRRGLTPLEVADVAREAINAAAVARLRGDGDPLDGHRLLCRLKVAAALGLLEGRLSVDEQDWQLAGEVMTVSDATRAGVAAQLAQRNREANQARGESEGVRAVVVAEKLEQAKVRRASQGVLRYLSRQGDWTAWAELRRSLAGSVRDALAEAVEGLLATGQLEVNEDTGRPRYRLTTGGAR